MGDEGMDPCECIWNHELNMRRLISFLRQSQSYCTDIDCTDATQDLPQPESAGNSFLSMFIVMALAVAMYMMRPRRNRMLEPMKSARNPHADKTLQIEQLLQWKDDNGAPPAPPRI